MHRRNPNPRRGNKQTDFPGLISQYGCAVATLARVAERKISRMIGKPVSLTREQFIKYYELGIKLHLFDSDCFILTYPAYPQCVNLVLDMLDFDDIECHMTSRVYTNGVGKANWYADDYRFGDIEDTMLYYKTPNGGHFRLIDWDPYEGHVDFLQFHNFRTFSFRKKE